MMDAAEREIRRAALAGLLAAGFVVGCGEPDLNLADTQLEVTVIGTRPNREARVVFWSIKEDGTRSEAPLAEATTDASGTTGPVGLGVVKGEVLVEVFGGSTEELVSGEAITLDATSRMALVVTHLAYDEKRSVVVSPVTTMAEALGDARLARGDKEPTFVDAHDRALQLVGDHFGDVDPAATVPVDPTTTGASTLTPEVRSGLVLAALSHLAERIQIESGVTANVVNSHVVTAAMVQDVASSEALFDGMGAGGALEVGSCPQPAVCTDQACSTVCDIGPRTAREYLAVSLADFIESPKNVTGLTSADIAEMKTNIAENTEPELFGDAPIVTVGPELSLWTDGFVIDGGIWWTTSTTPALFGEASAAEGDTVRVEVSINGGAAMPAQFISPSVWIFSFSAGSLAVSPATNTVVVAAIDGIGNRTQVTLEMRVDDSPASVEFLPTTVADEREDVVTFGTTVTHAHSATTANLGGTTCEAVYKHAYLMDRANDDNPIKFRFRVTDVGIGIDATSVQYRVRKKGAATWLTAWTDPDTATPITGGVELTARMKRSSISALGTDEGDYEIAIRGTDKLGQGGEAMACWNHNPLGPPLEPSSSQTAGVVSGEVSTIANQRLAARQLTDNNITPIINYGVVVDNAVGLMSFDVKNWHAEDSYLDVPLTGTAVLASISGTKYWRRDGAIVSNTTHGPVQCTGTQDPITDPCYSGWPFARVFNGTMPVTISAPIDTVRVFDITVAGIAQEQSPCSGCAANRFLLDAGHTYRVLLASRKLQELYPGDGGHAGPYSNYSITDIFGMTYDLTGKYLGAFSRCTTIENTGGVPYCTRTTGYRGYLALRSIEMTLLASEFLPRMASAASPIATGYELVDIKVDGPPVNYTWNPTDTVPN